MQRRSFGLSLLGLTAAFLPVDAQNPQKMPDTTEVPDISAEERQARCDKATRLMKANNMGAIFLEAGPSLFYFTGIRWGRSERMFAMLFPASGEPVYVVPGFEEGRSRELIPRGSEIRIWQEDQNPAERIAKAARDRGLTGSIGIEESVRFFLFNNLRKAMPHTEFVSADPVTAGCRMIKSPAELAILKRANRIALRGVAQAAQTLHEGITHLQFQTNCEQAMLALGCPGEATITFGKETASPHGSVQPQKLQEGDTIVLDAVCQLYGYNADITRSFVFGKPSLRQQEIWNLERRAQDAALTAVKPGKSCESIDAAARHVITAAGLGPDYRLPGLPHRTGHGIGLDVHEWPYLVRGNTLPLAPGMCFSDEPMIVIPGQFGIRLEDCFHVTETGAQTFTPQSPSLEQPFGSILSESL